MKYEINFGLNSLCLETDFLSQVFLINEVGADSFLRKVEQFEEENCV